MIRWSGLMRFIMISRWKREALYISNLSYRLQSTDLKYKMRRRSNTCNNFRRVFIRFTYYNTIIIILWFIICVLYCHMLKYRKICVRTDGNIWLKSLINKKWLRSVPIYSPEKNLMNYIFGTNGEKSTYRKKT